MRRLYPKLLAWFFVSFVAVAVGQIVVVAVQDPQILPNLLASDPAPNYVARGQKIVGPLIDAASPDALRNFFDSIYHEIHIEGIVWDGAGKQIAGRPPTPRAAQMARDATAQIKLRQVREGTGLWLYTAQKLRSPQGRPFVFVMREPSSANLTFPQGFAIALAVQALLCFGLARYIASPAEKLRRATRQFADGDLSVRVAPSMGRRRDELADLGRDFDAMAERIEALLQNERRLLVDVSHELRSPLARQSAALELARDAANSEVAPYLNRIERENERLGELIEQLMALTRMESGQFVLHFEPLDLSELANEVAEDLRFEGASRSVRVETLIAQGAYLVGDRELLRRALENVGRNALRYTTPERGIVLSLEKSGEGWYFSLRDFGPGVPTDKLGDIWEPFFRVHEARDRKSGGAGLGLAITQRSVALHGGSVKARNCENGGGLLIEMCLPDELPASVIGT